MDPVIHTVRANRVMVNRIEVNPEESYGLELVEIKRGDTMGSELGGRQFSPRAGDGTTR